MRQGQCGGQQRRRWRRERVSFTVLGRFAGGERLGRVVNISERGLGAVFQGRGYGPDQAVELHQVSGAGVHRTFGVVCSALPRGRNTRLGIRTFAFIPAEEGAAQAWTGTRRRTVRPTLASSGAALHPWGPGNGYPLVTAGGMRAMERERRELSEALRSHYAVRGDEVWDDLLRRFFDDLPHSPLRGRFVREQFRAAMNTRYPVAGGTEIRGRVIRGGPGFADRELPPFVIHLDYYAVATGDRSGRFIVRGIPPLDDPVNAPLRIANHAVLSTAPVAVHLPRLTAVRIEVELPILLRTVPEAGPTGAAMGEGQAGWNMDLDVLRGMVERL